MGAIRHASTGQVCVLSQEHVVGRATLPMCSQTIAEPHVSGVHALLRWTGGQWELRDLNSRNGTYLDGRRIQPNVALGLREGSTIGFGRASEQWTMIDCLPPDVMVVPLDGGDPIRCAGELLPLPSADDPRATVYRAPTGWVLESGDEPLLPLVNMQVFEALGRLWRFCCGEASSATLAISSESQGLVPVEMGQMHFAFAVSRDEEHVELRATCGSRTIDLGARTHHYPLLTLARRRLEDMRDGLPDTSCGWVDVEELARDPSMAPPRLNLDVYRARDQLAKAGVIDAIKIVERRVRPRQLRFGTANLSVRQI
jgi:hypothetical protein